MRVTRNIIFCMSTIAPLASRFTPGHLADLTPAAAQTIGAIRRWAVAQRSGAWAAGVLQEQLGCARAAAHVQLLIEEVGAAWPDPFCLSPLCCRRVSHDEALLGRMLETASAGDRPAFDRLCSDLLPADARDRLFLGRNVLAGAL